MLNQIVVVGRLVRNPEVKELEDGKKVSNVTVAIPRSYKNAEGGYDTDFIDCTIWNGMAENTSSFCRKGDLIGIKGRIQEDSYEKNGEKIRTARIIAEKLTYLSSKSKEELEEDNLKETVKEKKSKTKKSVSKDEPEME